MASPRFAQETSYFAACARRAPRFDREEEAALARRFQTTGDRAAADALARSHFPYVLSMAMKYRHYGISLSELCAEGTFGIVHALGKFEPDRGVRFATYANHWVRAYMLGHVVKSWSAVSGSDGPLRSQLFFKLRRERVRIMNQLGEGRVADEALAERLGLPVDRVQRMVQRLESRDVSTDGRAGTEARSLLDRLPAAENQEQALFEEQVRGGLASAVQAAIGRLDARERYIVETRLMAEPAEQLSLAEIARHLNISRERARQLETRAKRKLRLLIVRSGNSLVHEWLELELPAYATAS